MAIATLLDRSAIANCYRPGGEAARNSGASAGIIVTGNTVKQLNVDIVGSAIEESHTAGQVIEAGGGTYHEAETSEVEEGVMFGPASAYEGEFSEGTPLALPAKITGVAASPLSATSMRVSWALAPSTGGPAAYYRVYRAGVLVGTVTDALEYEDGLITALTQSTSYSYTVSGVNGTGEGPQSDAATGTTPATASPVPLAVAAPLSFYSVATAGDGATVDTLLFSGVYGTIDKTRISPADGAAFSEWILGFLFIPSKHLAGIGKGVKVIDANANILTVEDCEEFDDHQEITMRKVNP